jgi:hypothetical protein
LGGLWGLFGTVPIVSPTLCSFSKSFTWAAENKGPFEKAYTRSGSSNSYIVHNIVYRSHFSLCSSNELGTCFLYQK